MASKLKLTELLYPTSTTPAITINADDTVTFGAPTTTITNLSATNLAYTGTLTGGTGVINIGSGQVYKDASGNVGIGTVSPQAKLHVSGGNAIIDRVGGASILTLGGAPIDNWESDLIFYSSNAVKNWRVASNRIISGGFTITPSTVAGGNTFTTPAFAIDSSGNVGIGTSSPAFKLDVVGGRTIVVNGRSVGDYQFIAEGGYNGYSGAISFQSRTSSGGTLVEMARISADGEASWDTTAANQDAGLRFFTTLNGASAEKMRLDTSGNLLVGTTATAPGYGNTAVGVKLSNTQSNFSANTADWVIVTNQNAATNQYYINFRYSNSPIGDIRGNNTSVAYNTSSDYRLKENIAPMTGALAKVAALKPCTYTWKADGSAGQGFIAHELQAVVPDCVTGTKDAVDKDGKPQYQGVDTSFLVATLVAAIQELKSEFDAYKLSHP